MYFGPELISSVSIVLTWQRIWKSGERKEIVGPVRVVHRYVDMPEQSAEFYNETTGRVEEVSESLERIGAK